MANEKAKEDPRSETAKAQQVRREEEAAQRQAEQDAKGDHVDNTLPEPEDEPRVEHH
jgi:hypothetical protein